MQNFRISQNSEPMTKLKTRKINAEKKKTAGLNTLRHKRA